jgi:tRNA 5-methylaminomethyl-2-thiouridine biosynthesis bifunctional protein
VRLHRGPGTTWQALNAAGDVLAEAGRAVIALGSAARDLHWTRGLPLKVVRGQTTQIPAPPEQALRSAFCHRGYIAPAMGGEHCIGATFDLNDESREWRVSDNEANLRSLAAALPAWRDYLASLDPCALAGRAELRCVSPDYLPLAGPVADQDAFLQRYASLGQDARRIIDARAPCQPGLYLITAMGSRGLSYAALAAERLASELCGEPPPLSRELLRALSPARFILRGIVRGQHTTTRKPDA